MNSLCMRNFVLLFKNDPNPKLQSLTLSRPKSKPLTINEISEGDHGLIKVKKNSRDFSCHTFS
jgi:hypothetical protein